MTDESPSTTAISSQEKFKKSRKLNEPNEKELSPGEALECLKIAHGLDESKQGLEGE